MIYPLPWLRNNLRNFLRASLLGRALRSTQPHTTLKSLRVVSATRLTEKKFWKYSALGRSLKPWLTSSMLSIDIRFENKEGLPVVYNRQLRDMQAPEVLVFIHDDVWLDDPEWIAKIVVALERFDIVGVCGATAILPKQPSSIHEIVQNDNAWHMGGGQLAGAIGHGQLRKGTVTVYGPPIASCQLLDGVFLAMRGTAVLQSDVWFDEQFDFHFYDMDFCRNAKRAGLQLGTWPIALTHQSKGESFHSPDWQAGYERYLTKWKH